MDTRVFETAWNGSAFSRKAGQDPNLPSSPAEREAAFTALLQSGSGLKRVAFAMQQPLKNRLDYVAVGRKILLVSKSRPLSVRIIANFPNSVDFLTGNAEDNTELS